MKNILREFIKKVLSEGPIWNQGGIILIKGGQRLYATAAKNIIEIKPGEKEKVGPLGTPATPAKNPVMMAFLGDDFYRIKYDDKGELRAFKIGWKGEPSLASMLNFKNHKLSIVLNNNKTPLHWETLQFNNIGTMINRIKSQIAAVGGIDFYN